MDYHTVHTTGSNQFQQALQARSFEGGAGIAFIVEAVVDWHVPETRLRKEVGSAQVELDLTGGEVVAWESTDWRV